MYCSKCGSQIGNARFCSQCGTPLGGMIVQAPGPVGGMPQVVVVRAPKSPGVAFMIAYFCSLLLMWVLIGFIIAPILWIWSMVDAYKTAERINAQYGV